VTNRTRSRKPIIFRSHPEDLQRAGLRRAGACGPTAHDGTGLEHHLHVAGVHSFAQPTYIKSLIADRGQAIEAAMANLNGRPFPVASVYECSRLRAQSRQKSLNRFGAKAV
jgi:hypothetical protein